MRPDESRMLNALYEGVFEQPLWSGFLNQLRARTGTAVSTINLHTEGDADMIDLASDNGPLLALQALADSARDPDPFRQMRPGRVYALAELLDPRNSNHRAISDAMKGGGVTDSRSIRVNDPGRFDAWLSCGGGEGVNWPSVGAQLAELGPHFRTALRLFSTLERERFRTTVASDAFRRLNMGWITLDARCQIVDISPDMELLLQRTAVLRRGRYDRLTPASSRVDRELTAIVKGFALTDDAPPRAINLSRDPLINMLLRPVRDTSISGQRAAVAVAYVSGDRLSEADRCDQLVDLFQLLPSEARLAWAIAQGMSIAQAADALGLTLETARTYSKRIYAKTGSSGQPDLVRNILTSVLALA